LKADACQTLSEQRHGSLTTVRIPPVNQLMLQK
jgi:hypothetical protein